MIKVFKMDERNWTAFNKATGEAADIVKINDGGGYLATGKTMYRIDKGGRTIHSMIGHFQTAKSLATKAVK